MSDQWLVLGGWAAPPVVLSPLFSGLDPVYIDVNDLLPVLIKDGKLSPFWVDILTGVVEEICAGQVPARIAGWSTGAVLASALSCVSQPESLVLLSATPSFCTRPGYRLGQRAGVVQAMRDRFAAEREKVMADFALQCGISPDDMPEMKQGSMQYDTASLDAGLIFLSLVDLRESLRPLPSARVHVFHGADDRIIPWQAGEMIAQLLGGEFTRLEGGHMFYRTKENESIIRSVIDKE